MNDGTEQVSTLKHTVLHCYNSAIARKKRARVDRNSSGVLNSGDPSGAVSAGHTIFCVFFFKTLKCHMSVGEIIYNNQSFIKLFYYNI